MSRTPSIVLALRYTNTSPSESKCGCGLSHHVCVDVCAPDKRKRPTSLMYARATVVGKLTGEMLRLADRRATSAPEMQDIDQIENHMRDLRETFSKRGIARCIFRRWDAGTCISSACLCSTRANQNISTILPRHTQETRNTSDVLYRPTSAARFAHGVGECEGRAQL